MLCHAAAAPPSRCEPIGIKCLFDHFEDVEDTIAWYDRGVEQRCLRRAQTGLDHEVGNLHTKAKIEVGSEVMRPLSKDKAIS